ncbi:type II secretion system protein N [Collimonas sp. OK412]|jgi:general secretion pathway protein C|uniref:type II secretion system protein N n=1 Tax=Collimonas sp. (strain OK412) TaxID=1801619 RepID=UPI0008EA2F24|nr:type II secretion system protein N [Collimonas sp. OK412]SFD16169.1 general secretion pathway protein C [Collimonas sp. OK412]
MGGYFKNIIGKNMRRHSARMPAFVSLVLFMLLCACAAYWGMTLLKPPLRAVAPPPQTEAPRIDISQAAGLFGGHESTAASNYRLTGVVVAQNAAESVAILSAEGQPAQVVRVGKEVQPGTGIKEVHKTYVLLSEGGILKRLILPEHAETKLEMASAGPPAAPVPLPAAPPEVPVALPTAPAIPPAASATPPAVATPSAASATPSTAPATRPGRPHHANR